MDETRRRCAEELFRRVLDIPPDRRASYLDDRGVDPTLRAEVDALLSSSQDDRVASFKAIELLDVEDSDLVNERIGPYKLIEVIGEGGFGVVYMAYQEKPVRRKVALKIIKLGMDTKQVVARFEAERQALAMMEHPNIAAVFDGGITDTGRPYFVMELVKGTPITEYCDKNRLSTRQRLQLFSRVCRAVQHAHLKGVIHRDIKPTNILVTLRDVEPVPKIIDFGIAKALYEPLTDKTLVTNFRQFVGTPEYVSPEQAEMNGLDVDTRSDIYSLGVLLYELLTGRTPLDPRTLRSAGYSEILRAICEQPPATPSRRLTTLGVELQTVASSRQTEPRSLTKLIRGDLDWIVMKALEKDRTRRYETAAALAADIEHHLNKEPVSAGPPSPLYRFRKTVIRHKTAFGFVTALFVLVTGFGIVMGYSYAQAQRARDVAEANMLRALEAEERAKTESDFMHELLSSVEPSRAQGREISVRYVLDGASRRIEDGWLKEQPEVQAAVRLTIGKTYLSLGLFAAAESHLDAAEEAYVRLLGPDHPETLRARYAVALLSESRGEREEAVARFRPIMQAQTHVLGPEHADTLASMNALGKALWLTPRRLPEAEELHRQVLQTQRRTLGEEHADTLESAINLGTALALQSELTEAEKLLGETLRVQRRVLGDQHPDLARATNNLAYVFEGQGKIEEAEALYRESLERDRKILGRYHPRARISLNNLIGVLRTQGKTEEGRSFTSERIKFEKHHAEQPDADADSLNEYAWLLLMCEPADLRDPETALVVARRASGLTQHVDPDVLNTLARAHEMTGDIELAIETQQKAVQLARAEERENLWHVEYPLIEYLWLSNRIVQAIDFCRDMVRRRLAQEHVTDSMLADSLRASAQQMVDQFEFQLAEPIAHLCLMIRKELLPREHPLITDAKRLIGQVLTSRGKYDEAESFLLDVYTALSANPGRHDLEIQTAVDLIVRLYEAWEKPERAAEWRARLSESDAG
ncbi:MAG: serine/threonine protein kinase [Phycisphaerales bacterium]|nr:MAG: serine/threonine protein kinase [Phycisphaerales bacterium]